eukprot:jgi/Mesen1/2767/ME000170S01879
MLSLVKNPSAQLFVLNASRRATAIPGPAVQLRSRTAITDQANLAHCRPARLQLGPRTAEASLTTCLAVSSGGMESKPLTASHGPDDCIFCKIRDGKIPSYKVMETEHADVPAEELAGITGALPALVRAVRTVTGADGVNIAQNNGAAAGQVVFHVHFHVIPRSDGDGLVRFGKSGPMVQPAEANPLKDSIIEALKS